MRGPPAVLWSKSEIPVPLLLFEAVAFPKIWKLFIPLPNSDFLSQLNISNYTNINTVSAYSKSTRLPEPSGSVRNRANTTPVAVPQLCGPPLLLLPLSHLIQNSAEVHRAQSSECVIWLFVFNFPWKCWRSVDSGGHLVCYYSPCLWQHTTPGWGQLLAWVPLLSFLKHTLPGTLPCW